MTTINAMTALLTTTQVATMKEPLTIIHHPGTTTETDTTGITETIATTTAVTMMVIQTDTTAAVIEVRTGRASCIGGLQAVTCKSWYVVEHIRDDIMLIS